MIRYNEVSITTWISHDFKTLTPHGKLLWLYLLTGPIRLPLPGIYRAGVGTCTDDLGWGSEAFKKAFKELETRKMALADWDFNVIFLPNWVKYNRPPANPNVLKSWLGMLDSIPDCDLKNQYITTLSQITQDSGNDSFIPLLNEYLTSNKDKLNRPVVKANVVAAKDVSQAFLSIAKVYTMQVKDIYPKLSYFKNGGIDKLITGGASELEKLCRLDGQTIEEVKDILDWVVKSYDESNSFNWLSNLQSLKSVRTKSKNGNTKWENIIMSYAISNPQKKKREIDYSDVENSPI
tara:strand:- start:1517 stop:2392 length:876 start_codon:yes stop_codon:yes gene_type:complete